MPNVLYKMTFKKYLYTFLLLFLINFVAYSNSFHNSFHLDDEPIILNHLSKAYPGNFSLSYLSKSLNLYQRVLFYRPVSVFTLALNYHWGKGDPFGYHVFNFFAHLITTFILFMFLYKTLRLESCKESLRNKAFQIALFGSLLWSIHPIQTQAVTYIVQRMAVLGALFTVISVYFYAVFRTTKRKIFLVCMLLSCIAAFGSKEHTIVLPILILIYEWIFFQYGNLSFLFRRRAIIGILVVLLVITSAVMILEGPGIITRIVESFNQNKLPGREFSIPERLLTEQRVVLYYLSLIIYPNLERFNLDHDFNISHSWFNPPTTFLSSFIIIGLVFLAWKKRKSFPLITFAISWYFLTLLVESSFFNLELIFEHRAYLPSMIIFPIIGFGIISLEKFSFKGKAPYVSRIIMVLLVFTLGYATFQRNFIWKDKVTLWSDCLRKSPKQARCYVNLGSVLGNMGQKKKAVYLFQRAIGLDSKNFRAHHNLGIAFMDAGLFDKAIFHFREASRAEPESSFPFSKLGIVYFRLNDFSTAKKRFLKAIELNNKNHEAKNSLSLIYYYEGKYSEAMSLLQEIIEENHQFENAQFNLGLLYKKLNKFEEAVYWIEKSLERSNIVLGKAHLIEIYLKGSNEEKATEVFNNFLQDIEEKGLSKYELWTKYLAPLEERKKHDIYTKPISDLDFERWKNLLIHDNNQLSKTKNN